MRTRCTPCPARDYVCLTGRDGNILMNFGKHDTKVERGIKLAQDGAK
jgi:hypothetical protein